MFSTISDKMLLVIVYTIHKKYFFHFIVRATKSFHSILKSWAYKTHICMYVGVAHKKCNIHASCRSSNRTALETISLDHCSEGWSRWTFEHSVQHDHSSLPWSSWQLPQSSINMTHGCLRPRRHSYELPSCTLELHKKSFIPRCLYKYIWWVFFKTRLLYWMVCTSALPVL